jgi:pimeloyl-ACP methyl ester carboxylesterase
MSIGNLKDRYMKVGNINTRFWAAGDNGTEVILIHGLGGFLENWRANVFELAKKHRVYALDLVGFGLSDKISKSLSYPFFAQFVRDFMDINQIERASLVGNSMGGGVSIQFAIKYPDKLAKLILVNSSGLGKELSVKLRLASIPLMGELFMRPNRNLAAQTVNDCFYDPTRTTDEMVDIAHKMVSQPGAKKCLLAALRAINSPTGQPSRILAYFAANLPNIKAPTLIVWGKEDRILPVAHAYAAAAKIPNSALQVFDRCGHVPQLERSEEFNKLLLEFLDK